MRDKVVRHALFWLVCLTLYALAVLRVDHARQSRVIASCPSDTLMTVARNEWQAGSPRDTIKLDVPTECR